jgi:hypothetical protein
MNPNRHTDGVTPLSYLDWIQRGSTEDWKRLYQLCQDVSVARAVAESLPQRDPDLLPSALLWNYLLEDLYPDLHIDLKPERCDIGV